MALQRRSTAQKLQRTTPRGKTRKVLQATSSRAVIADEQSDTHAEEQLRDEDIEDVDPELHTLINKERERQHNGLELIASENFTSKAVMQALGSPLANKYSEGQPGRRYYGGNENIDEVEKICQQRALDLFSLNNQEWSVNVQPHSGSPANLAAYLAVLEPKDRIMGLALPDGGHLSHGFYTKKKRVSATSRIFESFPYRLHPESGEIDYDDLLRRAREYMPRLIIGGASAYPREIDWEKLRRICDDVGAFLLGDMAHISGLVASKVISSPFAFADIVTTTTHKSLCGPRAGMIFSKVDEREIDSKVNQSVFPGLQGGPHNHSIGALAVALRQANSPSFHERQKRTVSNAKAMGDRLKSLGHSLVSDGTDTHLVLINLNNKNVGGAEAERALELARITANKNSVPGDTSAMRPGGLRVGTPALTTRGFGEKEFESVADCVDRGIEIARLARSKAASTRLSDVESVFKNDEETIAMIDGLRNDAEALASAFPLPGL